MSCPLVQPYAQNVASTKTVAQYSCILILGVLGNKRERHRLWTEWCCTFSKFNLSLIYERWTGDSSVGTATRYGLDGPGIESRWGRDYPHPPRPALGPTQPPIQWVPGVKRPGRGVDPPPYSHRAPGLRTCLRYTSGRLLGLRGLF
jgi:hypothetical protein